MMEEKKQKMHWGMLKKNRCPKCKKSLDFESDKKMMMCTISCGFMIETKRMKLINMEQNKKAILYEPSEDNFSSLQRFDREDRAEPIDDAHVV